MNNCTVRDKIEYSIRYTKLLTVGNGEKSDEYGEYLRVSKSMFYSDNKYEYTWSWHKTACDERDKSN